MLLAVAASPAALGAQVGAGDAEEAYLRAVADHFGTPFQEVQVLSRWGLATGDIPVVLFVARQAGRPSDLVVAQRRRGEPWTEIARDFSLHAGHFHVHLNGPAGFLAGAYDRFRAVGAARWSEVTLSDDEVVGLVNVRVISSFLGVSPARAVEALGGGDVVAAYARLRGGGQP